jgi:hypothetical protein
MVQLVFRSPSNALFYLKPAPKRNGLRVSTAPTISRMGFADEQHAVSGEAKLLVWANALLTFTYSFIFNYLDQNDVPGIDDFRATIPSFRFVQAGVAVALKPIGNRSSWDIIEPTRDLPFGRNASWRSV